MLWRPACALPPAVELALAGAPRDATCGLDDGAHIAWAAVGGEAHVWRCDGASPSHVAILPLMPSPRAPLLAGALLPGGVAFAAACEAQLLVWPSLPGPPLSLALPAPPTALIARASDDGCDKESR